MLFFTVSAQTPTLLIHSRTSREPPWSVNGVRRICNNAATRDQGRDVYVTRASTEYPIPHFIEHSLFQSSFPSTALK